MRVGLRRALLTLALLGSSSACMLQKGQPLDLEPQALVLTGDRLADQGDLIAAHHLWARAIHEAPWSLSGVLPTLARFEQPLSKQRSPLLSTPRVDLPATPSQSSEQ